MRITVHHSLSPKVVIKPEDVSTLPLAPGKEYDLIVHPHEGYTFCERERRKSKRKRYG